MGGGWSPTSSPERRRPLGGWGDDVLPLATVFGKSDCLRSASSPHDAPDDCHRQRVHVIRIEKEGGIKEGELGYRSRPATRETEARSGRTEIRPLLDLGEEDCNDRLVESDDQRSKPDREGDLERTTHCGFHERRQPRPAKWLRRLLSRPATSWNKSITAVRERRSKIPTLTSSSRDSGSGSGRCSSVRTTGTGRGSDLGGGAGRNGRGCGRERTGYETISVQ
jgi:hypothetical protein